MDRWWHMKCSTECPRDMRVRETSDLGGCPVRSSCPVLGHCDDWSMVSRGVSFSSVLGFLGDGIVRYLSCRVEVMLFGKILV